MACTNRSRVCKIWHACLYVFYELRDLLCWLYSGNACFLFIPFVSCKKWWINMKREDLSFYRDYKKIMQPCFCKDHFSRNQFMCPSNKGSNKPRKVCMKMLCPPYLTYQTHRKLQGSTSYLEESNSWTAGKLGADHIRNVSWNHNFVIEA